MTDLITIFLDLLKQQVNARADQIWWTIIMVACAMIFISVVTQIVKEPIIKRWTGSSWIIRLSVLIQGIIFMFGHGLFFNGMFSWPQKIALGIFMGCFNIAGWHVWDWWQTRKNNAPKV